MIKNKFDISARIFIWPGDMSWHFVALDQNISREIRESFPRSNMVKIQAKILKVDNEDINYNEIKDSKYFIDGKWMTSLFYNKRDNNYIMPIKKEIRKKHATHEGDVLEMEVTIV